MPHLVQEACIEICFTGLSMAHKMAPVFQSLRHYLIVLLTVASAVSVWPLAEMEELDGTDSSRRPALSEEGPGLVAILHHVAQVEQPAGAQVPSAPLLSLLPPRSTLLLAHAFRADDRALHFADDSPRFYANKTGPPWA